MGAHGLGPHVVGQRVVVRRIVPGETGPTGGPAFTDVLGVCEAWGNGTALIRREDGSTVAIDTALVVSGKPVPPRPSVRHRVSAREAELRAMALFGDPASGWESEPLGEWVLRWERRPQGRARKRANSCLAFGDPGLPVEEAAARIAEFYRRRDRPALAQVEHDSDTERTLLAGGWEPVPGGDALFLLGSLARASRLVGPADRVGPGAAGRDEAGPGGPAPGTPREVAIAEDGSAATATIGDLARGEAVVDRDWLGLHALTVVESHRRRRLATRAIAALLEWGAERGATTVWLQVESDNAAARSLYEGLGLSEHHAYRYLRAPG